MSPVVVRLPGAVLQRRDWLLSAIRRQAPTAVPFFALAPDELRFARQLTERRSNLWIFRTHQQRACADFVLVDMSSPIPAARRAWVVEVKLGRQVRRGRGMQFGRVPEALQEIAGAGVIDARTPSLNLLGGRAALLAFFRAAASVGQQTRARPR